MRHKRLDVSNPLIRAKVEASLAHVRKMLRDCEAKMMLASTSGRYSDIKSLKDSHKSLTKERLKLEKTLTETPAATVAPVIQLKRSG